MASDATQPTGKFYRGNLTLPILYQDEYVVIYQEVSGTIVFLNLSEPEISVGIKPSGDGFEITARNGNFTCCVIDGMPAFDVGND